MPPPEDHRGSVLLLPWLLCKRLASDSFGILIYIVALPFIVFAGLVFICAVATICLGAWVVAAYLNKSARNKASVRSDSRGRFALKDDGPKKLDWALLREKVRADAERDRSTSIDQLSPAELALVHHLGDSGVSFGRPGGGDEMSLNISRTLSNRRGASETLDINEYQPEPPFPSRNFSSSVDLERAPTPFRLENEAFIFSPEEVETLRRRRQSLASGNASPTAPNGTSTDLTPRSRAHSFDYGNDSAPMSFTSGDRGHTPYRSGSTTPVGSHGSSVLHSAVQSGPPSSHRKKNLSTTSLSSVPEATDGTRITNETQFNSSSLKSGS